MWSPDGGRIAFQSGAGGLGSTVYSRRADGSGDAEQLVQPNPSVTRFPDSWTPDGHALLFNQGAAVRDIWIQVLGGDARALVKSPFHERSAMVSPDGKWFAFVSNESGRDEVYVQLLNGGAKVAVSTGGGRQPTWAHSGHELFYRESDAMMAVDMASPARPGNPTRLFDFPRPVYGDNPNTVEYDVGADGRFLAVKSDNRTTEEIRVIVDWRQELKAKVPTK
jgi:Tol biopolymer transport system component